MTTSSLGDEWQWISNDTAAVLRSTVESAFLAYRMQESNRLKVMKREQGGKEGVVHLFKSRYGLQLGHSALALELVHAWLVQVCVFAL